MHSLQGELLLSKRGPKQKKANKVVFMLHCGRDQLANRRLFLLRKEQFYFECPHLLN